MLDKKYVHLDQLFLHLKSSSGRNPAQWCHLFMVLNLILILHPKVLTLFTNLLIILALIIMAAIEFIKTQLNVVVSADEIKKNMGV